jgi:hypothetical protein
MPKFQNFDDFYLHHYLEAHRLRVTKNWHFLGTTVFLILFCLSFVLHIVPLIPIGIGCAYGCAWFSHLYFEKNMPATFEYPLWSVRGDFRMFITHLSKEPP